MKQIKFKGYNPFIRQLRTDKGWRVEFDVSQTEYDIIKELPKLEGKILLITIESKEQDFDLDEKIDLDN